MRQLQKHHAIYEQLKSHLKTEIVVREEILSLLKQDYNPTVDAQIGALIKNLRVAHKQRQRLIKKILQFSPLSTKQIPLHAMIDLEDECELDLITLINKQDTLKKEMVNKNRERKTLALFEKTFIAKEPPLTKLPTKKTQTLTIESQERS